MSQAALAEKLGVTFQQVQKYENGTNRIGAGRLQRISEALRAPIGFFFDEAIQAEATYKLSEIAQRAVSNQGIQLNRAFLKIDDPQLRRRVISLVRDIADSKGYGH